MDGADFLRLSQVMYQHTSSKMRKTAHEGAKSLLGGGVRRLRKNAGLSQEALALRIGADQAYISRIEAGHVNPTIETISELAAALEQPIVSLFEN